MRARVPRLIAGSIIIMLALAALLAWPHGSGASCGTNDQQPEWNASYNECHFWFKGFPLTVRGDATGPDGNTDVRVWIAPEDAPDVTIVECSATGNGNGIASCSNGLPDEAGEWPWPTSAQFLTLTCHVAGNERGEFHCQSGLGT